MMLFNSDSIGGSPPASMSNTLCSGFSLRRAATTEPAVPAPTTIKSTKSGIPGMKKKPQMNSNETINLMLVEIIRRKAF